MLNLAVKEGTMTPNAMRKTTGDLARGFLQEAVPNVDAAAKWSTMLKENVKRRETWEALTAGPGGKQLRDTMAVVENAAQIAKASGMEGLQFIPFGRAAAGGIGISYVTGVINPAMAAVGLGIAGTLKMMSTAYTQGNKGVFNLIGQVLRANSAGTAAGAKAVQAALPKLKEYADENGITDFLVTSQGE
jgi:hypothetical protein